MNETIQSSLKELYYSLGGNADNVRELDNVNVILAAMTALGIGAKLEAASVPELPEAPEEDGTYTLQVVIAEGEATYSWAAVE